MIARAHRFHGYNSLRYVYQHGTTVRGLHNALKYVFNPRRSSYRSAVVVGRKVHKSAVVRNRLRRRLYEAIRAQASQISQPYDLVFTVFSEQLNELTPVQLHELVKEQLQKASVLDQTRLSPAVTPPHAIVDERKR